MKYYVGLDLHSTNTYIGILDELGNRVFKKRVPNELPIISGCLEPYKEGIVGVVVESTFNWYWLVDGLMEQGYRFLLANPVAFQRYNGLKYTDDEHDAFFLALLLKLGILPTGFIFPKEERHLRDLLRKRMILVGQRTAHLLSFKSLINRNMGASIDSNEIKRLREEEVFDWFSDEHLACSAQANIAASRFLSAKILELEKVIIKAATLKDAYQNLLTIPGIGRILALVIMLETGPIDRFESVGNYASYCRCVPTSRLSNGKQKGKNNSKNGNKYLSWAFIEAANMAVRYCPNAKAFYQKKGNKAHKIVAIKALAHKMARACYWILKDNVPYDGDKLFRLSQKQHKGCGSEPERGLIEKIDPPIGLSAAAPS